FVLHAAKVGPRMEKYHRDNPDRPAEVESIGHVTAHPVPDSNFRFHVFQVVQKPDLLPGPVRVEQTKDGYRVDWPAYIEARDRELEKFCEEWREGAGTFRVLLERGHYFGDDVPDQNSKVCFK